MNEQNYYTERKIDFFPGSHGHFLELAINHAIDGNPYDISGMQFNDIGACHIKNYTELEHVDYEPITKAKHYSYIGEVLSPEDYVVRISVSKSDSLILITNSFLRAGDETIDLYNLHYDTLKKLQEVPKLNVFLQTLIQNHGEHKNYSRKILRDYFRAMISLPEYGTDIWNNWLPAKKEYYFNFDNFFRLDTFYKSLKEIAHFFELEFRPTDDLLNLYDDFIKLNDGWNSQLKCNRVLDCIIRKQVVPLDLSIIEEAWIVFKISEIFNLYEPKFSNSDFFPRDTSSIISEVYSNFKW